MGEIERSRKDTMVLGDAGGTLEVRWRDAGGTLEGRYRYAGGTLEGRWRDAGVRGAGIGLFARGRIIKEDTEGFPIKHKLYDLC